MTQMEYSALIFKFLAIGGSVHKIKEDTGEDRSSAGKEGSAETV